MIRIYSPQDYTLDQHTYRFVLASNLSAWMTTNKLSRTVFHLNEVRV